ncbi:MAG: hypothetical protein LBG17_04600 [Bacteroidales bacterium]|nr:hypothetical protein [Bacteroidales bacterium]
MMRQDKAEEKNDVVNMAILLFIVNYSVENFGTATTITVFALFFLFIIAKILL